MSKPASDSVKSLSGKAAAEVLIGCKNPASAFDIRETACVRYPDLDLGLIRRMENGILCVRSTLYFHVIGAESCLTRSG